MTQVQWFPGHMAKAIRLIEDSLKSVDFVIECRDARAPFSTRNPVLAKTVQSKKRLIILTKKDLANPQNLQMWIKKIEEEGHEVMAVDVLNDPIKKELLDKTQILMKDKHERDKRRGIRSRASRALIVGVPNVGKSTVINQLINRRVAKVENRPGVTQALKLIKVDKTLEIIDTPGVLWPKFETEEMGIKCALVGSIKETGFPLELVSDFAVNYLKKSHGPIILENYRIDGFENFFSKLAQSKGFLSSGGKEDIEKARRTFVSDVQNGVFKEVSWDY